MRKILFRGKSIRDGDWYEGFLYYDNEGYFIIMPRMGNTDITQHEHFYYNIEHVDENTVGEYVGINDDNGIHIFEGDIVKTDWPYDKKIFYIVEWKGKHCPKFNLIKKGLEIEFPYMGCLEVVGNIYDNKKLAKKILGKDALYLEVWNEKDDLFYVRGKKDEN